MNMSLHLTTKKFSRYPLHGYWSYLERCYHCCLEQVTGHDRCCGCWEASGWRYNGVSRNKTALTLYVGRHRFHWWTFHTNRKYKLFGTARVLGPAATLAILAHAYNQWTWFSLLKKVTASYIYTMNMQLNWYKQNMKHGVAKTVHQWWCSDESL